MGSPWSGAVARTLVLLAAAALIGWLAGHILPALLLATLGCLGWHLLQLYHLERWLRADGSAQPPVADGIWAEVYYHLLRYRERHRHRERKLAEILSQYQEATAAVPDAAAVLNDDGEVVWCNEAAQRLLGLRFPQDIGQPIVNLVRHPSFVRFLAERRGGAGVEFPAPTDTAVYLSVRVVPYGQGQRLLLATDVTRVQRLEQVRRDFVANVSHELRTPLTVIAGYLETLLDAGGACSERWRQPLRRMQEQATRMLHIIEDLLMLSRLETDTERRPYRAVNVPALLAAIVEDAHTLSGERAHQIVAEVDPELWMLGHEQELRSAFSNLVVNAVRYTPTGGRIVVRWFTDERGVHLEVEDNGEGIAPQHIPRLTERFYRVDRGRQRESGGTGLGLAIVKHVLSRHHGQLRIASQVGVGSAFACDFPPEQRAARDALAPGKALESRQPRR